jgi:hypothetical protein
VPIAAPRHPLAAPPSPSPVPTGEGRGEGSSSPCSSSSLGSDSEATPALLDSLPSPSLAPSDPQAAEDDARFPFYSAAQLSSGQFDTRYLIPDILAAGQPGGIIGSFKTLKTSLTADLLISLASGTPFLGQFAVPEPGRALFLSGESGLDALQSIAHRICAARGLTLAALENFALSPKLPRLDSTADLEALGRIIRRKRPDCLAIDPAYLAIRGEDAHNLFAMGALLRPLAELCQDTGCAILIVHHCKRTRITPGQPATLDDVAWTGFAEFAAQWLLLSRRRRFDPDTGRHELWFATGGRAGHHGLWALDVEEGSQHNVGGRVWKNELRAASSAEVQSDVRQMEASEDRRVRRASVVFDRDLHRTLALLESAPRPVSATYLRELLSLNGQRMKRVLAQLVSDGVVKRAAQFCGGRAEMNYSLTASYRGSIDAQLPGTDEHEEKTTELA